MKKIFIVAGLSLGLALGGAAAPSFAAVQHIPTPSVTCAGAVVEGDKYDAAKTNVWSVNIGGTVTTGTFGSSVSQTFPVPQGGATTTVTIHISDEDNTPAFTKDLTVDVGPCGTPPVVVPPAPIACVITDAIWKTEDVDPQRLADGHHFDGQTLSVNEYQRATGNMQGLTGMKYTIKETSGFPALVVVEVDPNTDLSATPGVNHYATISSTITAVAGVNDVQNALWYTSRIAYADAGGQGNPISWAAITALMPDNTLLSAPSLHLQTGATATDHTIVTSIESSCGKFNLVPAVVITPPTTPPPAQELAATGVDLTWYIVSSSVLLAGGIFFMLVHTRVIRFRKGKHRTQA